ncbi:hypothetical protein J2S00_000936 [Caldalkalibacillus uzonensis]|uniref:Uncharacterized protein n=1 Tax=Caldalkalibacillus uzonensis TaxID=353224 RepID=A0ABU0CP11_9BACI|nr:hypothetical protein [Caldalkalibacillus uzonensis]
MVQRKASGGWVDVPPNKVKVGDIIRLFEPEERFDDDEKM